VENYSGVTVKVRTCGDITFHPRGKDYYNDYLQLHFFLVGREEIMT